MNTVPNQKIIITHKETYQDNFIRIRKDYLANAYKILDSYAAVYLYICFAGNKDGYQFAFSPKAIANQFGMPASTVKDQIKKLIECGFLVQRHEGSNIYDFYETPQTKETKAEVKAPDKNEFNF